MYTLIGELYNWHNYFLRLLGFPDLFGKVFLITFKFSQLGFYTIFGKNNESENSLISFVSEKKKLAFTLFYCPSEEKKLGDCIDQLSFYNFSHAGDLKKRLA